MISSKIFLKILAKKDLLPSGAIRKLERQLAEFIGAPPDEVTSTFVGLNHMTFIYDLRWKGCDAWPLVRARLAQEKGEPFDLEGWAKSSAKWERPPAASRRPTIPSPGRSLRRTGHTRR